MTRESEWTIPVVVADLPEDGAEFAIVTDEATRALLAQHADVLAIPELVAHLHVTPQASGALVEGSLQATVRQRCVVTLEPFDSRIDEMISLSFVALEVSPSEIEAGEDDPPDPLVDGRIDLAAVITEFLTLSIDPYPRKPGALFVPPAEDAPADSPFAALAKLKGKNDGGKS